MRADTADYFAFYGLEPGFDIDEKALRQQYLQYSRDYHPDFFVNDAAAQAEAMQLSAYNNKAYKVLSDFRQRVRYLLELKGYLSENDKSALPPDFLMEMMEINEQLAELEFEPDEQLKQSITNNFNQLQTTVNELLLQAAKAGNLDAVKQEYLKLRYLERIGEQLAKMTKLN